MKGLLYNDLTSNKTNFLSIFIIIAYVIAGMILTIDNSTDSELNGAVLSILNSSIFAFSLIFPLVTLECGNESSKNNWNNYAAALPGGYKLVILEKYILCLAGSAIGALINIILIVICHLQFNISIKMPCMFLLFMNVFMLIIQSVLLPLFLHGKSHIAGIVIVSTIVLVVFLLFTSLAIGKLPESSNGLFSSIIKLITMNQKKLTGILIALNILGILMMAGSYKITVWQKMAVQKDN